MTPDGANLQLRNYARGLYYDEIFRVLLGIYRQKCLPLEESNLMGVMLRGVGLQRVMYDNYQGWLMFAGKRSSSMKPNQKKCKKLGGINMQC